MASKNNFDRLWLSSRECAQVLGLNECTLRLWRMIDKRRGIDGWNQPGRGGLRYRRVGRAVRYWSASVLQGPQEADNAVR
jgi:hypothetical protein